MAPRAKPAQRAGADDSEDDLATTATHSETTRKTAMPKAKTAATKAAPKRKAPAKAPRQALKDRTNIQDEAEADALDEEEMAPKTKRAKTTKTTTRKNAAVEDEEPKKAPAKRGRQTKRAPSPEPLMTIPETQQDPEQFEDDVEQSIEADPENMDIEKEPTPKQVQKFYQRAPSVPIQPLQPRPSARPGVRSGSAQPAYSRARSGSASGNERRGGDPELRRQLNELTKNYENLQLKYESLEDVGKTQAESNFDKLKRASDQKARDAHDLITSLKKELAELKKSTSSNSSETTGLQKQITTLTTTNDKLTTERDDLKSKLQVSQNETKSLEAKLIQARQQLSTSAQEAKAQADKKNLPAVGGDALKEAKMKENLYADLTGLIIRGVKQRESEDEYDCIQTGRNGTLHFHLSIANDTTTLHPKTPSNLSYEDAEFAYEPLLDESRDRELLDLLPDYLTEEICFPRNHAQRFYGKVVDSMTKRIVVEEED
ncbi:hypothetical protein PRZ48_010028 [Zasmidium cellare]|uniref:Monopolin complex subunit Csm1/Pcs1 C-terminal domain-containing protein n=1 Tax=Zasmidium cellare TaxID=395010 RepID=A0ABR0EEF0_ZASCE|nr:hypothetical protein PRZ48_010028 [Zasmidium cellare]